jgi:5'-phosphate synthase pdxT subunit
MTIAILALQGAFAEHAQMLEALHIDSVQIRNLEDWDNYIQQNPQHQGLIIPGGESTAMTRIIRDEGLYEPIRQAILAGMPVLGTCAGLIMLDPQHLNTMDITVRRNAYGRQLGSFNHIADIKGIGKDFPMTFIRAPYIEAVGPSVELLAEVDGHIVAARQGNQLVCAFHPELTSDTRVHEFFLSLAK